METTAYIALSRQIVLRRQMDVIAHNVANMNTTGFKAEALMLEPVVAEPGRHTELAFVQDFATVRDTSPGALTSTGNPFDLAIDGEGYFAVETEEGERYTRSGQFHLNDVGELVTSQGHPVRANGGQALVLPIDSRDVLIADDGTVSTAEGVVGRIDLVGFDDEQALQRAGHGYYRTDQAPAPAPADARLIQGSLERSNVGPVVEMTQMMSTTRAYQSVQRLVEAHHEVQRRAIERMLPGGS